MCQDRPSPIRLPVTGELLRLARDVAVEAADLATRLRREGVEVQGTKSSPIDIVTAADHAVEDLIRTRLAAARPADGFLGEESGTQAGTSGITWVVDPIDGTVNYLYDLPNWSVSIAAVTGEPDPGGWQAIAGAVAAPALGEVFTASAGRGAHLGDRALQVRPPAALERALLATGFHYTQAIRGDQARLAAVLIPRIRDLRRAGGAAIDLASVAAGRLDGYFEQGLNPWDQAAGALLVHEAGGAVTGLAGAAPSQRMVIAGHPALVRQLDELLQTLGG